MEEGDGGDDCARGDESHDGQRGRMRPLAQNRGRVKVRYSLRSKVERIGGRGEACETRGASQGRRGALRLDNAEDLGCVPIQEPDSFGRGADGYRSRARRGIEDWMIVKLGDVDEEACMRLLGRKREEGKKKKGTRKNNEAKNERNQIVEVLEAEKVKKKGQDVSPLQAPQGETSALEGSSA